MLKWQGDYTLPRLRAKLASKYLLHPDVEPEYAEFYPPGLGQTVISRKDSMSQTSLGFGGSGRLGGEATWASKTQRGFSSLGNSSSQRFGGGGQELPFSMRPPRRVSSVPNLGNRRVLVAPASLQPLPPGLSLSTAQSNKSLARTSSAASVAEPTSPVSDDPRALEKERQAELASRRFWVAAHGNQHYLQEEVAQIKLENPEVKSQEIVDRLKATQVCKQMNKARAEGAKIDWRSQDWDGATLLLRAVRTGSMALAMHLIGIGADATLADNSGRGLLHWVAIEGNAEMAGCIFETIQDLQPNAADDGGDTPLHLAAYHGHLAVVRLLVRAGADLTLENAGGFSALDLAEAKRMWHVTNYLSEYKLQQEDQEAKEGVPLRDLIRPCNVHRAAEVRKEWEDRPKPKK